MGLGASENLTANPLYISQITSDETQGCGVLEDTTLTSFPNVNSFPIEVGQNIGFQINIPACVNITSVTYDFGDGTDISGPIASVAHSYTNSGNYNFTAEAFGSNNDSVLLPLEVNVIQTNNNSVVNVSVVPGDKVADGNTLDDDSYHVFEATVLDGSSNPVNNVTVNFTATAGVKFGNGMTGTAGTCSTGLNGTCTVLATSTVAASYMTAVSVGGEEVGAGSPLSYNFVAGPATAANSLITVTDSPATVGSGSVNVEVTARDAFDNWVDNADVTFDFAATVDVVFDGGVLGDAGVCTVLDADDTATCSVTVTSTAAMDYSTAVSLSAVDLTAGPAIYTFNPDVADAAQSSFVLSNNTETVGIDVDLTATINDQFGNSVADGTVVTFATDFGDLSGNVCSTIGGLCADTVNSETVGVSTITAMVGGNAFGGSDTVTWDPAAANAAQSSFVLSTNTQTVGMDVDLTATINDQFGNSVADGTLVTFAADLGDLSGNACSTINGVCADTVNSETVGVSTITAMVDGNAFGGSDTVNWGPAAADAGQSSFALSSNTETVGINVTLTATINDQFGNSVADGTVVTFATDLGDLSGNVCSTIGGVCADTVNSETVGVSTIAAMVGGNAFGDSDTVTWGPAAADAGHSSFALSSNTETVGIDVTLTATIRDEFDNLVADGTTVTFAADLGDLSGNACSTTNGVCTDTVNSETVGVSTFTAMVGGNAFGGSDAVTWSPAAADAGQSSFVLSTNTETVGVDVDLTATIRDEFDNLVADGTAVTFATDLGNLTNNPCSTTNGVCTAAVNSEQVGTSTITATVDGDAITASGSVAVTWGPEVANAANSSYGVNVSSIIAGENVAYSAEVLDVYTNPVVDGTEVTFTLSNSNGATAPASVTCETVNGECSVTATSHTVGNTSVVGSTVDSGDFDNVISGQFDTTQWLTGPADNSTSTVIASTNGVLANGSAQNVLQATIVDANGNPVVGQLVTFSAPIDDISFINGDTTCISGVDGVCTVSVTSTVAGDYSTAVSIGAGDLSNSPVAFTFIADVPTADFSEYDVDLATQTVGMNVTYTAIIKDANDNLVADGFLVTFVLTDSMGANTPAGLVCFTGADDSGSGTCSVMATSQSTGQTVVTAEVSDGVSDITLTNVTANDTTTWTVGAPSVYNSEYSVDLDTQVVGMNVTYSAVIRDALNNPVGAGVQVNFSMNNLGADTPDVTCDTDFNGECSVDATSTETTFDSMGTTQVTASIDGVGVIIAGDLSFSESVTPDVIFGSGNANGNFTTDVNNGVEVGIRAKVPQNGNVNNNGDGTYSYTLLETDHDNDNSVVTANRWNFDWTINVPSSLDNYTYQLGMDADPGPGTDYLVFDPITPTDAVPRFDHAIGTDATGNGGGTVGPVGDGAFYADLLANNNVLQQSWRYAFFPTAPLDAYNPDVAGNYSVYLLVKDLSGAVLAKTEIQVLIEGSAPVAPSFDTTTWLSGLPTENFSEFGVNLTSQQVGEDATYTAIIKDLYGNLVADGYAVTFTLTDSNGANTPAQLSCLTGATLSNSGACSVSATSQSTGQTVVTAAVNDGVNDIALTQVTEYDTTTWTVGAPSVYNSEYNVSLDTQVVGMDVTYSAIIRDALNNPVGAGVQVNFTMNNNGANTPDVMCSTDGNGTCSVNANSTLTTFDSMGTTQVTASIDGVGVITSGNITYDQGVTPEVIFGLGNSNGNFTVDVNNGVEVGLRAKLPFVGTLNSNDDGTYYYAAGEVWNFDWTINTPDHLDQYTYQLGMDADPGPGTDYLVFDPVTPTDSVPRFDHAIGDNNTGNGGGTVAPIGDGAAYADLLANNNVLQQSWRYAFFPTAPLDMYDPNVSGTYSVYLLVKDLTGEVLAKTEIQVLIENSPAVEPTLDTTTWLSDIPSAMTSEYGVDLSSQAVGADVVYTAIIKDQFGNVVDDGYVVSFTLADSNGAITPATLSCVTGDVVSNSGTCSVSATSQSTGQTVVSASVNDGVNNIALSLVTDNKDTTTWGVGAPSAYNSAYSVNLDTQVVGVDVTYSAIVRDSLNNPVGENVVVNFTMANNGANTPDVSCLTNTNGTCSVNATSEQTTFDSTGTTQVTAFINGTDAITQGNVTYDGDVVPEVIFGSGNGNGHFTIDRNNGVEVGIRAKIPGNGNVQSNADGTYSYSLADTDHDNNAATYKRWNFDWTINTPSTLDNYTYQLGLDADPGPGVDYLVFDPVTPSDTYPWFDHSMGDGLTGNGAGTEATDEASYMNLLTSSHVLQQSWRYAFFPNAPLDTFNPEVAGTYSVYLLVKDLSGAVLAKTEIQVLIENSPAVEPTLDTTTWLVGDPAVATLAVDADGAVADGTQTNSFSVTVTDQFGNPIDNQVVSFTTDAAVTLMPQSCITDNTGMCSINASSMSAGSYLLDATIDNNTGVAVVEVPYKFIAGLPADVAGSDFSVSSASTTAGDFVIYSAILVDADGNAVADGYVVNFTLDDGGTGADTSAFSPTCTTTGGTGSCTTPAMTVTSLSVGATTVTASVEVGLGTVNITHKGQTAGDSTTWTPGVPAAATSEYAVDLTSQTVGLNVAYSAIVRDANSNLVADGITVTFDLTSSGGANALPSQLTCSTVAGVCDTNPTATSLLVGDTSVVASTLTSGNFSNSLQNTTNWTPGAASAANSEIVVTDSPATADNADTVTLTAIIRDMNNNLVINAETVTFTQPGDITLSSLSCDTNPSGECSVTARTTKASIYISAASVANNVITSNITYEFVAGPVDLTKSNVAVLTNNAVANGVALNELEASLLDQFFNPVKNELVTFAATPTVDFGLGVGLERTCLTGQLGSCNIFASSTVPDVYTTDVSVALGDLTGSPVNYEFVTGNASILTSTVTADPISVPADGVQTSSITVQLKDAQGNDLTVGGDTVALMADSGSSVISAVVDMMDGSYEFTVSGLQVEFITYRATVNGMQIDDSASVDFTLIDVDADNLHDPEDPLVDLNDPMTTDADGDGINDGADATPDGEAVDVYPDTDGDGIRDRADVDVDGDGVDDNGSDIDNDGINDQFDLDSPLPVITLIGDASVSIEQGLTYTDLGATAFDNADGDLTADISTFNDVDTSVIGTYFVTYDVVDSNLNEAVQVVRTVEVTEDATPPMITLLGDDPQVIVLGDAYNEIGATAFDSFEGDITGAIFIDATAVNTAAIGSYTVNYSVADTAGNSDSVDRTVNVVDTTVPVIQLLGDNPQTVEAGEAYSEAGADVIDNELGLSVTIDATAVNTAAVGSYLVTYNVTDTAGNAAVQVTRTVNVVDTTIPEITLLGANPQFIEAGSSYAELNATALDNIDGDISASIVIDASAVNTSVPGDYDVTYKVTDSSGNEAVEVIRIVTVEDNTAPVITLNGFNSVTIESGSNYNDAGATATDAVDGNVAVVIDASAVINNVPGSYQVTFNASDATGNDATEVIRTVIVEDTTVPVIQLIGDNPLTLEAGTPYVELGANVIDVETGLTPTIQATVNMLVPGTYFVTYNAVDSSGNTAATVIRIVSVQDTTAPVLELLGDNPQTIEAGQPYVEEDVDVIDNEPGLQAVIDSSAVNTNVPGSYLVTYNLTDSAGNVAMPVTRDVIVVDTTAPVIQLLGDDPQTVEAGEAYVEAGADVIDNESGLVAVADSSAVNTSVPGTYGVTYNVTDSAGNTAIQVTRDVNVVDTIAPVIQLLGDDPLTVEAGTAYVEAGADVIDNESGLVAVADSSAVNTSVPGTYGVTYNVTDSAGNAALEVTRQVDVIDTTAPVIQLLGDNPLTIEKTGFYDEQGAEATDFVDDDATLSASIVIDDSAINLSTPGSYEVTYDVSDAAGNAASTVIRTVIVTADIPVVLNDSYSINEDGQLIANDVDGTVTPGDSNDDGILANDLDPDGESLSLLTTGIMTPDGIGGTLNIGTDGSLQYLPPADAFGTATVTYEVTDGTTTVAGLITIEVLSSNDAPTFNVMGNVDVTGLIDPGNTLIEVEDFVENIVFGPANESGQVVDDYLLEVTDSQGIINTIDVDDSGMLSIDMVNGNYGVAIVTVRLRDDGGTDNDGQDTSLAVEFMVIHIDEDLIFENGFEQSDKFGSVDKAAEAGSLVVDSAEESSVYYISFEGYDTYLDKSYSKQQVMVIVGHWIDELLWREEW